MRRALFWGAAATVAYTYVGFPLLVLLRGKLSPRPYRVEDVTPPVSVVLAAYNEEACIGERLENVLVCDYPPERLEVVVASDGSDDRTNEIVLGYESRGVRLLALPRAGKNPTLSAGARAATGDILVFTDANTVFAPDAIRAIVRPFADPTVGGVAGNQVYLTGGAGSGIGEGEHRYWDFDRMLKSAESSAGSTISATGALYAIRRTLYQDTPNGVTDDFVSSTAVIEQGSRLVFVPDAVAYEHVAATSEVEFGRKVRVMTRGLRGVLVRRRLLDPRRYGFYSLQLFSHKVLRRLMVFPLIVLALSSASLWRRGLLYRTVAAGQAVFYGLGALGLLLHDRPVGRTKILALPAFFCLVNVAALKAVWNLSRGTRLDRWEPQRTSENAAAGASRARGAKQGAVE